MQELADTELLRRYVELNSDEAFSTLVARHINLVYSAALRKTGNAHAAEEITQAVFIILAKKARGLRQEIVLSGWLYQTARLTAANYLRNEIRRAHREQEAYMQSLSEETESNLWRQIAPHLEDAMGQLGEKDRNAIALRFFQGKSFQELAIALGGTENAAKKRVHRTLEKLRTFFAKRGIASTTAIIAGLITANSVQAAPVPLAASISAAALAKGAAASSSTLTLVKGAIKLMAWTKMKMAALAGVAVLLVTGTTALVVQQYHLAPHPAAPGQTDFPRATWAFAGYSDARSAFLSALWARSKGDFKIYLRSLSPEQAQREREDLLRQMNFSGKSEKAVVAQIAEKDFSGVSGFRVRDQVPVSAEQTLLHVDIQGPDQKTIPVIAKFRKVQSEWKFDGFERTNIGNPGKAR